MRVRPCGSVRSDCRLSAERAIRNIVIATSSSTPKMIPRSQPTAGFARKWRLGEAHGRSHPLTS